MPAVAGSMDMGLSPVTPPQKNASPMGPLFNPGPIPGPPQLGMDASGKPAAILVPNLDMLNNAIDQRISGIAQTFASGFLMGGQTNLDRGQSVSGGRRTSIPVMDKLVTPNDSAVPASSHGSQKEDASRITDVTEDDAQNAMLEGMGV